MDRGGYEDYAAVARALSFTRARVSQVMDLLLLAPDLQERVLELEAVDGREPLAERQLRPIVLLPLWTDQRLRWHALMAIAVAPLKVPTVPQEFTSRPVATVRLRTLQRDRSVALTTHQGASPSM